MEPEYDFLHPRNLKLQLNPFLTNVTTLYPKAFLLFAEDIKCHHKVFPNLFYTENPSRKEDMHLRTSKRNYQKFPGLFFWMVIHDCFFNVTGSKVAESN